MIPSRGFARASPGLAFRNQILSRAPVRSIPRQATPRPTPSPRQFGTSLRSHGRHIPRPSPTDLLLGSRIGAAGILSCQSLLANRRFASTDATTPASSATHTTASEIPAEPAFSSLSDLDAPSILNVPEGLGYLANLGIDYGTGPTSVCQWVVEHLHITMGLPWWGSIVGAAVVFRLIMVYPALLAQHQSFKSQELRKDPIYNAHHEKFMASIASSSRNPAEFMQVRMQLKYMEQQHGLKKYAMFLPMLQIPFAFGMFKLTRAMGTLPVPGLETAGTLWFTDLTVADPLYMLPCVGAFLMYLSVKSTLPHMAKEQAAMMKIMPWVLGPITILVTISMPASVQLYFAAAAILQYFQTLLWHMPLVRKLCRLPPNLFPVNNTTEEPTRPASPFVSRQGTYQAPRTVATTATEHKPVETKMPQSPLSMWRDAKKKLEDSVAPYIQDDGHLQKQAKSKYEKRKLREDREGYLARTEDARSRQEQKKAKK